MLRLYSFVSLIASPVVTFGGTLILSILFSFTSWYERFFWLTLLFSICFMIPAIWYGELLVHGRIDTDVKNKKRRARLLHLTAFMFAASYIISLSLSDAGTVAFVLLASVLINIIYTIAIKFFNSEFSAHLGGITFLVLFLGARISPWYFALGASIILLLARSRYALKMHTFPELIGGFLTSVIVYGAVAIFL